MGSLQTFEIVLREESKERNKIVGLKVEFELPDDEIRVFLE